MTATGRLTLATLCAEDLEPLVGSALRFLLAPGVELDTDVVEVQRHPHGAPGSRTPFSLILRSRLAPSQPSALWTPVHDSFEPEAWFVNRIMMPAAEPGFAYFEALFA